MRKCITITSILLFSLLSAQKQGKATYYADKYNGRKTANGETFLQSKLTGASNTYKLGTILKVTNTDNDKSVIVKINDTGAFTHLVDLSKSAFQSIGNLKRGWLNVIVEVIK